MAHLATAAKFGHNRAMKRLRPLPVIVSLIAVIIAAQPARAQEAPYEDQLLRLSEILGSLHFLRNLCGEEGNAWRNEMEHLLDAENPQGERRARYIASFNRGYRAFAALHTACTASSMAAIDRYMKEGEALSREIVARFGG